MNGIYKLLKSGKFYFSMIIYIPSTIAMFLGKLDSTQYTAIVSIVSTVFITAYSISDITSMKKDDR